jgi:hypothetical protein
VNSGALPIADEKKEGPPIALPIAKCQLSIED